MAERIRKLIIATGVLFLPAGLGGCAAYMQEGEKHAPVAVGKAQECQTLADAVRAEAWSDCWSRRSQAEADVIMAGGNAFTAGQVGRETHTRCMDAWKESARSSMTKCSTEIVLALGP